MRESQDGIVGAVTGSLAAPRSLLLGRFDTDGPLQYTGRGTTLTQAAGATLAGLLSPAAGGHPWTGWTFSAGWGSKDTVNVTWYVAQDSAGRWSRPHAGTAPAPTSPPVEVALFGG
ncbi:hypothetical protein ACFZAV_27210 [Streptomyces sp. NPDC008343]|uniref:hypothetical protein n=1 Tax=Streptomyces sp. NPDC008343 TaxID=3364828 RepID=UPI0036F0F6CB